MPRNLSLFSRESFDGPENVLFGFYKRYAEHIYNFSSQNRRNNTLMVIMALVNSMFQLLTIRPYSEEANEQGGEVLKFIVLLNYLKRTKFQLNFSRANPFETPPVSPRYWTPFSPFGNVTINTVTAAQDLLFIGQVHTRHTAGPLEPDYTCPIGFDLVLKHVLEDILNLIPYYTDLPFKELALREMIIHDESTEDFSHETGWDFLGINYFL